MAKLKFILAALAGAALSAALAAGALGRDARDPGSASASGGDCPPPACRIIVF
ncbi:MAG: hypothetical protein ACFB00_11325 [Parvularculaceae bacterium]